MTKDVSNSTMPAARKPPKVAYPVIIGLIIAVGAILVMRSSFSSGTYSLEVADVVEQPGKFVGRDIKLTGMIKEGSVRVTQEGLTQFTYFALHDGTGKELPVAYPHNPPDPFKEGRECIVEGHLDADGVVQCTKLTVKCPSKYQTEDGTMDPKAQDYYEKKYGPEAQQGGGPTS